MNIDLILDQLVTWLSAQSFTPAIRELSLAPLLPAASYPQLAVVLESEEFGAGTATVSGITPGSAHAGGWPGASEAVASISLRLSCAAGRPADALSQCRKLAHQVRSALHGGGPTLGGTVKQLSVGGIAYAGLPVAEGASAVVATAEIALALRYVT
jgi:hypothetical protein